MNRQRKHHKTVDEIIFSSKNSIIDKFILASLTFGVLAFGVALWRNVSIGISSAYSSITFSTIVALITIWFMRKRIPFNLKAAILFIAYLLVGINGLLQFGPFNTAIIFLIFCCLPLVLSSENKWVIIASLCISLTIPLRAYLHFSGLLPVDLNLNLLVSSPSMWITFYTIFMLSSFILFLGVGQLRSELNMNFGLLKKAIWDLEETNDHLKKEMELRNIIEEDLAISSQKFKTLFEGSRDCVILLNSKAEIVEANPAAWDLSGYSLEELRSANIFELVDPQYRSTVKQNFELQIDGSLQPQLSEVIINSKEGKAIPAELNSNLIVMEDEIMIISTIRDISFRKLIENEKFNAALAAEESERARFSKDLHDDLGPVFSTLKLYLETLSKKETDSGKKEILDSLSGMVESAVKQVREISHNLSPYLLRDAGIAKAIPTHLMKIKGNETLKSEFETNFEETQRLPHTVEVVIYRVFLELLNNTLKHSGADLIKITLDYTTEKVYFTYIDNGKGFDIDKMIENTGGIGLKNIQSRVKSLRGSIECSYENNQMIFNIIIPL